MEKNIRQENAGNQDEKTMLQGEDLSTMMIGMEEIPTMLMAEEEIPNQSDRELYQLAAQEILADRYVIEDVLGFGGFGITYSAWDKKLEVKVAIKEYYPAHLVNRTVGSRKVEVFSEKKREEYDKGLQRFLGEAQNMAQFYGEKNIVNVYNYFRENGTAYLVMEFLDGMSLKEYTEEHEGRLPFTQVIDITQSLISALKTLHNKKIIHRDISPDNIFMCKDGTVKLIDFGAARFEGDEDELRTRTVILKPGYAPPEQYRSKGKQGPWTDIYALGATMYRTVTGIVPDESVNREVKDTIKEPREYLPEIPKYFNNILMRCLALQPQMRFRNIEELEKKLTKKKTVTSVKGELRQRKLTRAVFACLLFALLLFFGGREIRYIRDMKNQANLEECTISVLVMEKDGEEGEDALDTMKNAITEFEQTYPFVHVELESVSEKLYGAKINQLAEENQLPVVFESDMLDSQYNDMLRDLSYTHDLLQKDAYRFGDRFTENKKVNNKMATGFDTVVCYQNTKMMQDAKPKYAQHNDLELFLSEKSAVYIGTIADYAKIQSSLAGLYEVVFLNPSESVVDFVHSWSVAANGSNAQQNAGERLIYYLMNEQAQDVMYIQNENELPLYNSTLEVFLSVNPELEGLSEANTDPVYMDITSEFRETIYQEKTGK